MKGKRLLKCSAKSGERTKVSALFSKNVKCTKRPKKEKFRNPRQVISTRISLGTLEVTVGILITRVLILWCRLFLKYLKWWKGPSMSAELNHNQLYLGRKQESILLWGIIVQWVTNLLGRPYIRKREKVLEVMRVERNLLSLVSVVSKKAKQNPLKIRISKWLVILLTWVRGPVLKQGEVRDHWKILNWQLPWLIHLKL